MTNVPENGPVKLTEHEVDFLVESWETDLTIITAVERLIAEHVNASLAQVADQIEAELICCDIYERLNQKRVKEWTERERGEYRAHSICYWGAASRNIVNLNRTDTES